MQRFEDEEEPLIPGMIKVNPIIHKFFLTEEQENEIRSTYYKFGFGSLGEFIFNSTLSRKINGLKEKFPDVVVRVVNWILSIRKNYCITNGFEWCDLRWAKDAVNIGKTMMKMHFLPQARDLYMSGTEYSYKSGGVVFNNCGFCSTKDDFIYATTWIMDSLMLGCSVGIDTEFTDNGQISLPGCDNCRFDKTSKCKCGKMEYVVHDSREGWIKSIRLLLKTYFSKGLVVYFDYSSIRNKNEEIKGFGGFSTGYKALEQLHNRIRSFMECYVESKQNPFNAILNMCVRHNDGYSFNCVTKLKEKYDELNEKITKLELAHEPVVEEIINSLKLERIKVTKTYGTSRLISDIFSSIAICVVSGNHERIISIGIQGDDESLNLKNYTLNPERESIGWVSNNIVSIKDSDDFKQIPKICDSIRMFGEPGIFNNGDGKCVGLNSRSGICLEDGEYCCSVEMFPSKCETYDEMVNAAKIATFYASTISLLSTHWTKSNSIIARNRKIGVSLSGVADLHNNFGFTVNFNSLYKVVREENKSLAIEAGVPDSASVTAITSPGISTMLAGVSSDISYKYAIRNVKISSESELVPILKEAGLKCEPDHYRGEGTLVFRFPTHQVSTKSMLSIWEQAMRQITLQREWSDNCVNINLCFNPETEGSILENVINQTLPLVRNLNFVPNTDTEVYIKSPYEKITEDEYHAISSGIKVIKWELYKEDANFPVFDNLPN